MNAERWERARCSLEGLSVGDAFGERFFTLQVEEFIARREVPPFDWRSGSPREVAPEWNYTDDTMMDLSIVESLRRFGRVNQNWLARDFAGRYDGGRGYGPAMHGYLRQIREGGNWRREAPALFDGRGSFGNGAAMRVAPLGGYYADNLKAVIQEARRSTEVTHAHPEGIAGAIAVAVGAANAWQIRKESPLPRGSEFLRRVLPYVPESQVKNGIQRACDLDANASVQVAARILGDGSLVSAQDTVPFSLWCAARHLDDYEAALWQTVSVLGDRDTTCAIVGGIVVLYTGVEGIPVLWRQSRERLPSLA